MSAAGNIQKFTLPTMPFHRGITNGLPIASSVQLTAKAYQDKSKNAQLRLITNNSDVALRIILELGPVTKVKLDCTVSQKTSTNIENSITLPFQNAFVLRIRTFEHNFQVHINDSKIADFVHRVDPRLIRSISIEGPLICEEVVVDPSASILPSYDQATSLPTDALRNLNLNMDSADQTKIPLAPSAPLDLPPPPPNVMAASSMGGAVPSTQFPVSVSNGTTSSTSSSFFFTGGSQGFSNHPYPLPGLIDQNTYASQQNPTNTLPPRTTTTVPPTNQVPPINTQPTANMNSSNPPYPTGGSVDASRYMSPPMTTPAASQPYTVTFPSPASTPMQQGPLPQQLPPQAPPLPQNRQPAFYQNTSYNPQYQFQPPPPQTTIMPPPVAMGPPIQPGYVPQPVMQMPQTYITPIMQQQPFVQYQPYYQPGVVYYETDYHSHHHHHHRHHHC